MEAGEIDKVKTEAIKAVEDKYAPVLAERDSLRGELYQEKVGGNFARSKFIAEKVAVPVDMVQAFFGHAFKVEDGKVVAYGSDGNKVFSRSRPGEVADFDEALSSLIDQYPQRDSILKGTGAQGAGSRGAGAASGGQKTLSRAQLASLSPSEQMAAVKGGAQIID